MTLSTIYNDSELKCVIADEEHVIGATDLINHAFKYQDEAKGDIRITSEKLRERMQKSEFYVFIDKSNKVMGTLYIDRLKDSLHFGLLALDDSLRGGVAGREIVQSIEMYAKLLHKHELELDYMGLSPWLKSYYEKYGFKETGLKEDIGWCELIRMTKSLK